MSQRVIGVDCSTKALAFAELDGAKVKLWLMVPSKRGLAWQARLHELADHARTFFKRPSCLVYVEEAPMGRSFRASVEVGYVVSAVIVEAMRAGHIVVPVNVSTWKKQTIGKGNADKGLIREWATRYVLTPGGIDPLPKEQDLYDAAAIAAFARQNLRGAE